MLSNSKIKFLKSLHSKKFRIKHSQFIIEGHRIIKEAHKANVEFDGIWCSDEYAKKNKPFLDFVRDTQFNYEITSEKSLSQVCDSKNNQGIIGLIDLPNDKELNINSSNFLILDNISDPGNMGTILRTAVWFGIKDVILSSECVDLYNSKVVRSAMGAHFHLNQIIINSLDSVIPKLQKDGFSIIGAELDGTSINKFTVPNKWALVLGSEAHGISPSIKSLLDESVTILNKDNIESLNVAVATGIILNSLV